MQSIGRRQCAEIRVPIAHLERIGTGERHDGGGAAARDNRACAAQRKAGDRIVSDERPQSEAPGVQHTFDLGPIAARPNTEQALFFTGHSLGGALALIAAERAARDPAVNARATGVYVFGCPRAGGDAFFNSYTPLFGDSTFRLVHGSDIVATVPPAGLFRHVGRPIQCDSGRLFTSQTPMSDHDKRQTRDG